MLYCLVVVVHVQGCPLDPSSNNMELYLPYLVRILLSMDHGLHGRFITSTPVYRSGIRLLFIVFIDVQFSCNFVVLSKFNNGSSLAVFHESFLDLSLRLGISFKIGITETFISFRFSDDFKQCLLLG